MSASSPSAPAARWQLEHSYAQLPDLFHTRTLPSPVRHPQLVAFNAPLAAALGLPSDLAAPPANAALFTGNQLPPGAQPLAQAYAGHQFGHFAVLGDGRAILLGEQIAPTGQRFDIQLKGAGLTPFSRGGDGRAALGPMLREYLISEAMHALAIPTTRSLAVASTGETVARRHPLPGAVLTRVASSHLRVGTFQWAAAQGDPAALQALADYAIQRHYPEVAAAENPYHAFLLAVISRQAALIAQWMLAGFVHGVMNTDNMAISGETIDYGPCAFLDAYDPATVFSSIDHQGRYAYAQQPLAAQWNLARFAETLLPLLHPQENQALELAQAAIQAFPALAQSHRLAGFRKKLGLFNEATEDAALAEDLLSWMHLRQADYTHTFRTLHLLAPLPDPTFALWHQRWAARLTRQPQSPAASQQRRDAANPAFIPRNHLVEAALAAAADQGDFAPFHRLAAVLAQPFAPPETHPTYSAPPTPPSCPYQTFCGT